MAGRNHIKRVSTMSKSNPIIHLEQSTAPCEVFLNFRGPDTRQGFTNTLFHCLKDAGVRVFQDDEAIRVGEEISGELEQAINDSKIYIPIFSKNYASSSWCLRELALIMESKKKSASKVILPIFYNVTVDDVKLKTDAYRGALWRHKEKFTVETVKLWEEALMQIVAIKGWELKDEGHGDFSKLVVREVLCKLKWEHGRNNLVGFDDKVEAIEKLLDIESKDVRFVVIHGKSGIGKTALAQFIFNKFSVHFKSSSFLSKSESQLVRGIDHGEEDNYSDSDDVAEDDYDDTADSLRTNFARCSFLADVGESSKRVNGLKLLEKQLIGDILGNDYDDDGGLFKTIKERLRNKKVLVVLDDVDEAKQITKLLENFTCFGCGSRVIVTTTQRNLMQIQKEKLENSRLRRWSKLLEFEMREMNFDQALQLFSRHAFYEVSPPKTQSTLSRQVVASIGGLPLTLEVVGSFLHRKSRKVWIETINKLKKLPYDAVKEKLKMSYNALEKEEKQIFLEVACSAVSVNKEPNLRYLQEITRPDAMRVVEILTSLSLVKVLDGSKLWMHNQVRELGWEITGGESSQESEAEDHSCRSWTGNDAVEIQDKSEESNWAEEDGRNDGGQCSTSNSVDVNLQNYRLGLTLDTYSFGKVIAAEHLLTGCGVAIRIINRRKIGKLMKVGVARELRRNLDRSRRMLHPHIRRIYEVIETPSDIYIVLEQVESRDLFDYLAERGRLEIYEARRLFQQIISGLEYCHQNGMVHKGLKLENILLDRCGNAKIAEFGLRNFSSILSRSSDRQGDVWCCGVILYALLFGELPFEDGKVGDNEIKRIKHNLLYCDPDAIRMKARDLISGMLAVDPAKRITVSEILDHPWFRTRLPGYLKMPMPPATVQHIERIAGDILEEMDDNGWDCEELVESLLNGIQTDATIAYYMLLDQNFPLLQAPKLI